MESQSFIFGSASIFSNHGRIYGQTPHNTPFFFSSSHLMTTHEHHVATTITLLEDDDTEPISNGASATRVIDWLISDVGAQLPDIMRKLSSRHATQDWNEDLIQLAVEDWLKLESYGVCWIHSYGIEYSRSCKSDKATFYDKLCSICRHRMHPKQFPLLEPMDNSELPFEFSVLAFPVHNRTEDTETDHWSLLLFFLDEHLELGEQSAIELYHFDSLAPYNHEVALSYAKRLHSQLNFFVRPAHTGSLPIRLKTVSKYPRQSRLERDCGSRIVRCASDLISISLAARPTSAAMEVLYNDDSSEGTLDTESFLGSLNRALEFRETLDEVCLVQYLPICLAQYQPYMVVWDAEQLDAWLERFADTLPYVIWVQYHPEDGGLAHFVVVQPRQRAITTYAPDYWNLESGVIQKIVTTLAKARDWSNTCVNAKFLSYAPWFVVSRVFEYLVRICDRDRLVPHRQEFFKALEYQCWKEASPRHVDAFYRRMTCKYLSRLHFRAQAISRPLQKPRFNFAMEHTYFDVKQEVMLEVIDYFVFVRNGIDRIRLECKRVVTVLAQHQEEFHRAVATTPQSNTLKRNNTYEGPYLAATEQIAIVYLLDANAISQEQWERIKFTLDVWLVSPTTNTEMLDQLDQVRRLFKNLRQEHGDEFDMERIMISLLRLFIALVR